MGKFRVVYNNCRVGKLLVNPISASSSLCLEHKLHILEIRSLVMHREEGV